MAAELDLLRAKVAEEKVRDSLERLIKERKKKKKKKREPSPSVDKRDKCEKEAKKLKLNHHHHQHAEPRSHQPHQLQQKTHNFKHVLHNHHEHQHHSHGLSNGTKKSPQPVVPSTAAPRKAAQQPQKKRALAAEPLPPALFTFTPLTVVKAKPLDVKEKNRENDVKLKPRKENAEANVKHPEQKKKTGEFLIIILNFIDD